MNNARFLIINFCTLLLIFPVTLKAQTPEDILRLLQENNSWCKSVSCEVQTCCYPGNIPEIYNETNVQFIRDYNRLELIGNYTAYENGRIFEEASHAKFDVAEGKKYLNAIGATKDKLFRASIRETKYQENLYDILNDPDRGSPLWGRIFGNQNLDIYEIISKSPNLTYDASDVKTTDGKQCYELKGENALGTVTIFLSPEKGMIPLGWLIEKKGHNYFNNSILKEIGIKSWKASYKVLKTNEVDGNIIPTEGGMEFSIEYDNGKIIKDTYEYKVMNIKIAPDFDALGAFKFDLPSDVPVHLESIPGIVYNFHDGKLLTNVDEYFLDQLNETAKQIKYEMKSEVVETTNKATENFNKETPVVTDISASPPTVENIKPKDSSKLSTFSVVALVLAGVIVIGIGGWLVFYLVKRGNHVES